MNLTSEEMACLEIAKTKQAWNKACDEIKQKRNGAYPPDWWPRVFMSGLLRRKEVEFSASKLESR